jgi:outer membrane lipoprotein LolB
MEWQRAALACVATAAALLGCATPPPPLEGEQLSGRLSMRVDGDATRSFQAGFELAGTPERGRLLLTTPIGTQVAQAEWSPSEVRLVSSDGVRVYPDLESLAVDALGERVPLAALFDWLNGRPWGGAASTPTPPSGFEQLGWQVDLARRAEGWVEARRVAPPVVTVRAKLDAP